MVKEACLEKATEEVFRKMRKDALWLTLNGRPVQGKGTVCVCGGGVLGLPFSLSGRSGSGQANLEPLMGHRREGSRLVKVLLYPILENNFGVKQR